MCSDPKRFSKPFFPKHINIFLTPHFRVLNQKKESRRLAHLLQVLCTAPGCRALVAPTTPPPSGLLGPGAGSLGRETDTAEKKDRNSESERHPSNGNDLRNVLQAHVDVPVFLYS